MTPNKRRSSFLRSIRTADEKKTKESKLEKEAKPKRGHHREGSLPEEDREHDNSALHFSQSVPVLVSHDSKVGWGKPFKRYHSDRAKHKRREKEKSQPLVKDNSSDSPSLATLSTTTSNSAPRSTPRKPRSALSARLPERGKKSATTSRLPSPRTQNKRPEPNTNPDVPEAEITAISDSADTTSPSTDSESCMNANNHSGKIAQVQIRENETEEMGIQTRDGRIIATTETYEGTPSRVIPLYFIETCFFFLSRDLTRPSNEFFEILNAAEIAHYQQKYKSAISLYRFLREYVINFHVAYRLYVYYFNGLGGLEKDTNKALQYVKEAIETADPTDPLSNYDLANLYESGHGFKKDEELSLKLYAVAAEQNCSKAQYNLGLIYSAKAQAAEQKEKNSDAVEQNKGKKRLTSQRYYKKSFKYFKMSADQGFPGALCNLGVMYQLGEGVEQDSNRAIEYYKLAAEENYAVAHYNLGLIYEIGLGDVPMNLDEAVRCYEKASLSRHGGSEFSLATMYKKGRGVCKDYDISFHYFQKSARHGCVRAYYYIGNMYRKGQGVPMKDKEMALQYYLKAAQFQYCKAYNKLGLMYARGSGGIDRDYQQAVEFYKLGADHGSSRAQYNLGVMYERGKGIQTNPEMAFYYFKLSAEQGYVKAQYNLGWMYQNGRGVVVDNRKAIEYLTKASEQKSPEALYYLGWLYFYGEGTDVDKELAIEHWKLSAFLGYKKARQILEEMAEKNILFM